MKTLRVNLPKREYDIHIGENLLRDSGRLIREVYCGNKVFTVTDSNVAPLYGGVLRDSLGASGIETELVTVPAGETSKSPEMLSFLYDKLLEAGITRGHLIAALGGGVVGDLTGYAAATLLRGIPFVQIPTTLLAQVDSSVGGKVAVNHPRGKNLIGTFCQPKMVIADVNTLDTLPPRVFADGMGEVIKHGAIADAGMFTVLEKGSYVLDSLVHCNCNIKRRFVEADEFDKGERFILNFGHTFGHAIEKAGGFKHYTHGEAVGIGMVMAAELGERLGITKPGTSERLRSLLTQYRLPSKPDIPVDYSAMLLDKKRSGDTISLILLREIGQAVIHRLPVSELEALL